MPLLFPLCCDILLDLKLHDLLAVLPTAADPQMLLLLLV